MCMYCEDGINDLIALASAEVGVAIGAGDVSAAASFSPPSPPSSTPLQVSSSWSCMLAMCASALCACMTIMHHHRIVTSSPSPSPSSSWSDLACCQELLQDLRAGYACFCFVCQLTGLAPHTLCCMVLCCHIVSTTLGSRQSLAVRYQYDNSSSISLRHTYLWAQLTFQLAQVSPPPSKVDSIGHAAYAHRGSQRSCLAMQACH